MRGLFEAIKKTSTIKDTTKNKYFLCGLTAILLIFSCLQFCRPSTYTTQYTTMLVVL